MRPEACTIALSQRYPHDLATGDRVEHRPACRKMFNQILDPAGQGPDNHGQAATKRRELCTPTTAESVRAAQSIGLKTLRRSRYFKNLKDHPASIPSVWRYEPASSARFRPDRERRTRSLGESGGPGDGESRAVASPSNRLSPKPRGDAVR